jgi:hypothetical protein
LAINLKGKEKRRAEASQLAGLFVYCLMKAYRKAKPATFERAQNG